MNVVKSLQKRITSIFISYLRIVMDSSKIQDNQLTVEDWDNRWKEGRTGWHRDKVNGTLESHFDKFVGNEQKQRILFPLCGKTIDMKWVADKGHIVVGVDGSEKAAKEFFQDQKLEYKMDAINMAPKGALIFSTLDETIRIFICNMFDFRSSVAGGQFHGVFDRGSLVAINPKDRPRYAELMGDLILPGGKILAECLEYDPTAYGGPPHHVPEHHVREIYSKTFDVQLLERKADLSPLMKQRFNLDAVDICSFLMTRK